MSRQLKEQLSLRDAFALHECRTRFRDLFMLGFAANQQQY
jgi:hypothetical protein